MKSTENLRLMVDVGSNIRKWRQIKGIKQDSLAVEIEISKVSMSKIETGKTDISLSRLYSIANALKISIELLFIDPFQTLTISNGLKIS